MQSGAGVTLVNRGAERGNHAAELLSLPYLPLPDFDAEGFDIVVNAHARRPRHQRGSVLTSIS